MPCWPPPGGQPALLQRYPLGANRSRSRPNHWALPLGTMPTNPYPLYPAPCYYCDGGTLSQQWQVTIGE